MRLRNRSTLVCVALMGSAFSCQSLYGDFAVDNMDNCARNGQLCTATDACNDVTKLCEPAIVLTSVTPRFGINKGGDIVVLTGHLLSPDLTVLFDGVPAMLANAPTDNGDQLTVQVPANPGKKGPSTIDLIHPKGQKQRREALFNYYSAIEFNETTMNGPRDPRQVLAADWNNDGKIDLAVCDNDKGELQLFPGNGDGTFGTPQATTLELFPTDCAMGDVTGDGKRDVVAIEQYGQKQQVILGDGAGGFAAQPSTMTVGYYSDATLVDLNGDGKADLLTGDPPGVTVQFSDGAGGFSSLQRYAVHVSSTAPVSIAVADLNGDGKLDIVTGNGQDSYFGLLTGDGQGGFPGTASVIALPKAPKRVVAVDVNEDKRLDLIASGGADHQLYVSLAKSDGTYEEPQFNNIPSNAYAMSVLDMNGDGHQDILWFAVVSTNNFGTFTGLGDGTFVKPQPSSKGLAPSARAVMDLNGDGKPDIVIGEKSIAAAPAPGKLRILLNKSE